MPGFRPHAGSTPCRLNPSSCVSSACSFFYLLDPLQSAKCGTSAWWEVEEIAAAIRAGQTSWEELALDDIDTRYKWAGLFHRRKRTPGKFMMRLKVNQVGGSLASVRQRGIHGCVYRRRTASPP